MESEYKRNVLSGEDACLEGVEIGIPDPLEMTISSLAKKKKPSKKDVIAALIKQQYLYGMINALDADMKIGEQYDLDTLHEGPPTGRFYEKNTDGYLVLKKQVIENQ